MTEEEKQLLIKDICARLPYGVFVKEGDVNDRVIYTYDYHPHIETCKPYLRPMSSMTEEEKLHYIVLGDIKRYINPQYAYLISEQLDYLNAHHFDYRGLIEKGLAIKAPNGMYNTSQKWTPLRSGLKENEDGQIVGGVKL